MRKIKLSSSKLIFCLAVVSLLTFSVMFALARWLAYPRTPTLKDIEADPHAYQLPLSNELLPPAVVCVRAGCSGQLCVDANFGLDNLTTTCQWQEEYACYQAALCEVQANGQCGFTPSPELEACLTQAQNQTSSSLSPSLESQPGVFLFTPK